MRRMSSFQTRGLESAWFADDGELVDVRSWKEEFSSVWKDSRVFQTLYLALIGVLMTEASEC